MTLKFFLLDYIEKFHQDHPGIHLSVTNAPTPQTLSALKGGNIDLCVVSGPLSELEHLVSLPVKEIQDVFVASPSFRPESTPLSFEELSEFPLIMLEKTTSTRAYVDQHIRVHCRADKLPRPTIELATSDLVLEFAKRGIGIGSVVRDFAADALQKGELLRVLPGLSSASEDLLLGLSGKSSSFCRRKELFGKHSFGKPEISSLFWLFRKACPLLPLLALRNGSES